MATKTKKSSVKQNQARRSLKPRLAHHRHTFKLLPNHHTDFPLLVFILLLVGVFSWGWTAFAKGDAYTVNAVVPAQPLTVAAIITHPANNAAVRTKIITVGGSCPVDSYVNLTRNGVFSGTDLCQSDGSWQVQLSLLDGKNSLQAQDYNVTDQPGPASAAIQVIYEPSTSTGAVTADNGSSPAAAATTSSTGPLILSGGFTYQGVNPGQPLEEKLSLTGGTAPYAVSIDWGDGETDLSSYKQAGTLTVDHTYNQLASTGNSYTIKVTASDATGQTSLLQMMAIVTAEQTGSGALPTQSGTGGGAGASSDDGGGTTSAFNKFWRVAGPTYAVSAIGLGSFWLGQQQQLLHLHQRAIRLHLRRPRR